MNCVGDDNILNLHKTAFLCSRKIAAGAVLKCYDWAIVQRDAGRCVMSGFQSRLERDVLHYLLKGTQPVIVVLARGLKSKTEPEFIKPIDEGRLLIISPFDHSVKRITEQTAMTRNKLILELADDIVIGYASPESQLNQLLSGPKHVEYLFRNIGPNL